MGWCQGGGGGWAARLWVPACAGRTSAGGPSCALRTGFDRLRANGFLKRACDGVCRVRSASKSVVGGGGPAPALAPRVLRPPVPPFERLRTGFDFPQGERTPPLWIPAFAGMTRGDVRERRETETPPCLTPALDSRFRGKDDGGVRRPWALGAEGVVPACEVRPFDRLRANGFRRVPTVFGSRGCERLVVGVPSPARVWVT